MLAPTQRLLAHLIYLRRPARRFLPVLLGFILVLFFGGLCFHQLYHEVPLTFRRALYITYALVFMEHLLPFPDHWLLQTLYVVLPPLGLVVVLDGIVQFGIHILRRDPDSGEWNRAMSTTLKDHVILCGLGKAGLRILQHLLALGEQVCVLEKDPACHNLAFAKLNSVPVVVGSGRQEGILDALNIACARSIVLATDDDLANIELALDAKKARPEIHVVLRVFDQELAAKIRDSFGIPLAFSTTTLAAPLFATAAADASIVNAFEIGGRLFVVAQVQVSQGSELAGKLVKEIGLDNDVFVLSFARGGQRQFTPAGGQQIEAGDVLTVQTSPEQLRRLHAINRGPSAPAAATGSH